MNHRVVLLSTSLGMGGADRQVIYLAKTLLTKGYQVQIVSMTSLGKMGLQAQAEGLPVQSLNMKRGSASLESLTQLIQYLREEQPQVLTTFMYHANILGRVAGFLAKVPVIISSIRNESFGGRNREMLMRITNWMDDMCTTNSDVVAQNLVKRRIVKSEKMQFIPNGILLEKYSANRESVNQLRATLNIPDTAFMWLAVGRLLDQKDYPNLLQAFSKLTDSNVYLAIAGEGKLLSELQQQVQTLGLSKQVFFLGVRTDIPDLLAIADGFVLSSAWEGMPNVVMEALASSTPVVATQVGGVSELVQDGVSGFVVPPRNSLALAEAMERLMNLTDEQRQQMGEKGLAHITANYSLEKTTLLWEQLYQQLLSQN